MPLGRALVGFDLVPFLLGEQVRGDTDCENCGNNSRNMPAPMRENQGTQIVTTSVAERQSSAAAAYWAKDLEKPIKRPPSDAKDRLARVYRGWSTDHGHGNVARHHAKELRPQRLLYGVRRLSAGVALGPTPIQGRKLLLRTIQWRIAAIAWSRETVSRNFICRHLPVSIRKFIRLFLLPLSRDRGL